MLLSYDDVLMLGIYFCHYWEYKDFYLLINTSAVLQIFKQAINKYNIGKEN